VETLTLGPSGGSFVVPEGSGQSPLDRTLRALLGGESWGKVRRLIETGKVRLDGEVVREPTRPTRPGQTIQLTLSAPRQTESRLANDAIVYVDAQLVVVHKPSGISTVPYDDERGTLDELVARQLTRREGTRRAELGVVHRLDKETSGLLVFSRTLAAKRELKNQFRFHTVRRRYWALVQGALSSTTIRSQLVADRGDGLRGSTENPRLGQTAVTHVRKLEALRGATLVECQLETGRTHQIRIHLSEAGHPVLGERVYVRRYEGTQLPAPRVMLHAFELGFEHPVTRAPLRFESTMPDDMTLALSQLRG
jgi:23S rRNA pseudouridine1911/1915/1917 synthase